VRWLNSVDICIVWMNRRQNVSLVSLCSHPDYQCREVSLNRTTYICMYLHKCSSEKW
jgi:hypothetical protein